MWDFIFVFSEERKVISFGPPLLPSHAIQSATVAWEDFTSFQFAKMPKEISG